MKLVVALLAALSLLGEIAPSRGGDPPSVVPNDNRAPAGRLHADTLFVSLVLDLATWRPEGDSGPSVVVPALAEEGGPPRIPAPLIRVRAGTVVVARVRNALAEPYRMEGLFPRPAEKAEPAPLPASASHVVTFVAGEPGSYLYGAFPAGYAPPASASDRAGGEAEQASGALIIDPPDGALRDRVLVINIWGSPDSGGYRNVLAINGLSWPHTERFEAVTGDTVRWRVINASSRGHPMHLHGFYFTVEGTGDRARHRTLGADERRLAVTEHMLPYSTLALSWVAGRPGNWLFHCHFAFHVVPASARLMPPAHHSHSTDPDEHMAGLVLGVQVRARPGYQDSGRGTASRRYLFAQEGKRRGRAERALGYVLQRGGQPPVPDSVEIPGSLLVLEQDTPADVVVVNRLHEPVAVHWHGLELESRSDGVAGWSGMDSTVAPAVAPGDSFVARLSVPRAGTFIYHTHMNDVEQLTSGLYGAIVVLEPGRSFDQTTDHVLVLGWDGAAEPTAPHILVNGDSLPSPLELSAASSHRLRFVDIGAAGTHLIELRQDTTLLSWRRLAQDGADLPASTRAIDTPARHRMSVGQTADFEVRLPPGRYRLIYWGPPRLPPIVQAVVVR